MLLRPAKVIEFDDPENPQLIEKLIAALGAEPCIFPERNECCGGYTVMDDPNAAMKRSRKVYGSACIHGADEIVTACPLCRYNLVKTAWVKKRPFPLFISPNSWRKHSALRTEQQTAARQWITAAALSTERSN